MNAPRRSAVLVVLLAAALAGCRAAPPVHAPGTDDDPKAFLKQASDNMLRLSNDANEAGWVQETYITQDTEALASRANEAYMNAVTDYAKRSATLESAAKDEADKRQLLLLRNSQTMAAPS